MKIVLTLFILTFLLSCNQEITEHTDNSIYTVLSNNQFGDYNRKPITNFTKKPYTLVGKLEWGKNSYCTASLIGEDIIISAAHCFLDKNMRIADIKHTFILGKSKDGYLDKSEIILSSLKFGDGFYEETRSTDWAIVKLKKPLGKDYGFFSIYSLDEYSSINKSVSFLGYTAAKGGKTVYEQKKCKIRDIHKDLNGHIYTHDCDITRGDSGGPLFLCSKDRCELYGINVASSTAGIETEYGSLQFDKYNPSFPNVATPSSSFDDPVLLE